MWTERQSLDADKMWGEQELNQTNVMTKEEVEALKNKGITIILDGITTIKGLPILLYVGGKGYEPFYSLFDNSGKHIGFIKAQHVRNHQATFDDVIV